ncbi:hypothetical protein K490DRAFT_57801 [Saccharata proteae CBS 121410]|uniref:Uncharacterized protein n=1 Tax=Saccharata proteae CBS 121410 TaxID=1314787 RepID=A0A9P4LVZ1_9PEZI|nr:hypothetical protein K490DRAFT_57801 [Saccharata proteae CBS 121410]
MVDMFDPNADPSMIKDRKLLSQSGRERADIADAIDNAVMNEDSQPPSPSGAAQDGTSMFDMFLDHDLSPTGSDSGPVAADPMQLDASLTKPKEPLIKYPNNDSTAGPNYQHRETQVIDYNVVFGLTNHQHMEFTIENFVNKTTEQILGSDLSDPRLVERLNHEQVSGINEFIKRLQPIHTSIMEATYLGDPGYFLSTENGCRYHFWHRMRLAEEAEMNGGKPSSLYVPSDLAFKIDVGNGDSEEIKSAKIAANYQALYNRWYLTDFRIRPLEVDRFRKRFCVPGTMDFAPDIIALIDSKRAVLAQPLPQNLNDPRVIADLKNNWPPSKAWPESILHYDGVTMCQQAGLLQQDGLVRFYRCLNKDVVYPKGLLNQWVTLRKPLDPPIIPSVNPAAFHSGAAHARYTAEEQQRVRESAKSDLARLYLFVGNRMKLNMWYESCRNRDLIGFDNPNDEWNRKEWGTDERTRRLEDHMAEQNKKREEDDAQRDHVKGVATLKHFVPALPPQIEDEDAWMFKHGNDTLPGDSLACGAAHEQRFLALSDDLGVMKRDFVMTITCPRIMTCSLCQNQGYDAEWHHLAAHTEYKAPIRIFWHVISTDLWWPLFTHNTESSQLIINSPDPQEDQSYTLQSYIMCDREKSVMSILEDTSSFQAQQVTQARPEPTVEDVVALVEAHLRENTALFFHEEDSKTMMASKSTLEGSSPYIDWYLRHRARRSKVNQIRHIFGTHPDLETPVHAHFDARLRRFNMPSDESYMLESDLFKKARMTLRAECTGQRDAAVLLRVEVVTYLHSNGTVAEKPQLLLPAAKTGWEEFKDALTRMSITWETKEWGYPKGLGEKEGSWKYLMEPHSSRLNPLNDSKAFERMRKSVLEDGRAVVVFHERMLDESKKRRMEYRERSRRRREDPIVDKNGDMFFEDIGFEEAMLRPRMGPAKDLSSTDGLSSLPGNRYRG